MEVSKNDLIQTFELLDLDAKKDELISYMMELSDPHGEDDPKEPLEKDPQEEDADPEINDSIHNSFSGLY